MNLRYSIPGKMYWINNFLDFKMYKGIHNAIIKERKKLNLHSSNSIWNKSLTAFLKPPLRVEVNNYEPFEKLKTLIKYNPFFKLENITKINTTIHCMPKGSGVNWHDDSGWKYGVTYYLNNRWDKKWGGEFMFTNENGHGFIPVQKNSLIIVKSPVYHKVNTVLVSHIPRLTIQMFIK
tara:strand:+ start:4786 stop:5319 length:534 start_codon:yes stop_codon:yes gene_type:complete